MGDRIPREPVRVLAALAAAAGWTGLTIQLSILLENMGVVAGLWRYFGYFTILTNIGVACVASAIAAGKLTGGAGPRGRLMSATAILIVGIVYSLTLRALWQPQGWQKVADAVLHDAVPLLWLGVWLAAPHVRLKWREIGWALLPPATYAAYALVRGAMDGWYAYWFLDPSKQNPVEMMTAIAILLAGFGMIAAALVAVDRLIGRKPERNDRRVDEAGMESFPASDPPSWTLGRD